MHEVPLNVEEPLKAPLLLTSHTFNNKRSVTVELLPASVGTLISREAGYTMAVEQLREHMFSTMSRYRTCRLSDERYIDRQAWY